MKPTVLIAQKGVAEDSARPPFHYIADTDKTVFYLWDQVNKCWAKAKIVREEE
jgi:hypothetical protein